MTALFIILGAVAAIAITEGLVIVAFMAAAACADQAEQESNDA